MAKAAKYGEKIPRIKRAEEENDIANVAEYNDLCVTCNYAATCVRRKHHGKPVWYCEEFDDYQPPAEKSAKTSAITDLAEESEMAEDTSPRFKGLCCNCENRETCVIPKSEGGVWHCEEYC